MAHGKRNQTSAVTSCRCGGYANEPEGRVPHRLSSARLDVPVTPFVTFGNRKSVIRSDTQNAKPASGYSPGSLGMRASSMASPRVVHHVARHRDSHVGHRTSHVSRVTADQPSTSECAMSGTASAPRVFCISDLHTDFPENLAWCKSLSDTAYLDDAIILGGDVSDDMSVLEETLNTFTGKFKYVFFTPGNHDLWHKGKGSTKRTSDDTEYMDSMQKLTGVLDLCATCGVHTKPKLLPGPVWVVPVLSWHHASFDFEPDIPTEVKDVPPPEKMMSDFRLCKWPEPLSDLDESVAGALDAMNDTHGAWASFLDSLENGTREERTAPVLSFSHFLPRLELIPEKRFLFYANLPKAVGSDYIFRRIEGLGSVGLRGSDASQKRSDDDDLQGSEGSQKRGDDAKEAENLKPDDDQLQQRKRKHVHVFGHTHFGWDQTIEGIRYVQAPVSYPHEWTQRPGSLIVGVPGGSGFDLSEVNTDALGGDCDDVVRVAEPLCIWDEAVISSKGGPVGEIKFEFVQDMHARWSDFYEANPREPDNMELAWWVKGGRKTS
jgi:hypothetical protein